MSVKVAIVLPYFGNGGAEKMVSLLASNIDTNSIELEVICVYGKPQGNTLEKDVTDNGISIEYIGKGLGFSFKAIADLWKELSRFRPNIVHTHLGAGAYCGLWVLCHKVKMLHTVHNVPAYEFERPKKAVLNLLYHLKKAIPVAISKEIQGLIKSEYKLNFEPELVYNPVDIKKYAYTEKLRYPSAHHDFIFITVGRLAEQKNQKMMIEAFERMLRIISVDAKLLIVGEGPLHSDLESYINEKKLSDRIHLIGQIDCVEQYLAKADVFALSSDYEGLPLSILEAMASGLPIISTDVGGIKDIVTDNGILVSKGSSEELCDAFVKIINDSELRDTFARNSLNNVRSFGCGEIAKQYMDLYKKYAS